MGDKFFSIKYFNYDGLELVSTITGLCIEELIYEVEIDNYFISQNEQGRYYTFCESSDMSDEITFNKFLNSK